MLKNTTLRGSLFHLWTSLCGLIWVAWLLGSDRFQAFYIAPEFHPGFGHILWLTPWIAYGLLGIFICGLLTGIFQRTRIIGHSLAASALLALLMADKIAYLHTPYLLTLMLLWSVSTWWRPALDRYAKWMLPLVVLLSLLRFGINTCFAQALDITLTIDLADLIGSLSLLGYGFFWLSKTSSEKKVATIGVVLLLLPFTLFIFGLSQGPLWSPSTHYFTWQYATIPTTWQHHIVLHPKDESKPPILLNSASVLGPYTGRVASSTWARHAYIDYIITHAPTWWNLEIKDGSDEVFVGIGDGASRRY